MFENQNVLVNRTELIENSFLSRITSPANLNTNKYENIDSSGLLILLAYLDYRISVKQHQIASIHRQVISQKHWENITMKTLLETGKLVDYFDPSRTTGLKALFGDNMIKLLLQHKSDSNSNTRRVQRFHAIIMPL